MINGNVVYVPTLIPVNRTNAKFVLCGKAHLPGETSVCSCTDTNLMCRKPRLNPQVVEQQQLIAQAILKEKDDETRKKRDRFTDKQTTSGRYVVKSCFGSLFALTF